MRTTLLCAAAASAITIAGCSASTSRPAPPAPEPITAPLNLCAPVDAPPKDLAAQQGYAQYAVTVTDAAGNPVRDMKQSDFVARIGSQPLPIKYFQEDNGDLPQSIVVVIDESGSMKNKLVVQDSTALQSVRRKIADATEQLNKCDEVAAIALGGHLLSESAGDDKIRIIYPLTTMGAPTMAQPVLGDDKIRIIQPLTTDHALALSQMTQQVPWGQTPLYDGIIAGLQLFESAHYPNRVMIIVTDGLDNTSNVKLDEVLSRAKKDSVPIYMIGIGAPNLPGGIAIAVGPFWMGGADADRVDANTLKALSVPSGGQYYVVSELAKDNGNSFVAAVGKVAGALRHGGFRLECSRSQGRVRRSRSILQMRARSE
jgi:hypothetical protein